MKKNRKKKNADLSRSAIKLMFNLINIMKMGQRSNQKNVYILVKIIVNFSDFSVLPIFVIFVMKLDANFSCI